MKKAYSTPEVEKINFQYRDQVVVASSKCTVEGQYKFYVGDCSSSDASAEYNQ